MNIKSLYGQLNWHFRRQWDFCIIQTSTDSFLRCFFLPGIRVGYVQIFLVLTRPHAPRANTLHSWATLQEFHWASAASLCAAEYLLNLKWHGWLCWDVQRRGGFGSHFSDLACQHQQSCSWCLCSACSAAWLQLFLEALPKDWWELRQLECQKICLLPVCIWTGYTGWSG